MGAAQSGGLRSSMGGDKINGAPIWHVDANAYGGTGEGGVRRLPPPTRLVDNDSGRRCQLVSCPILTVQTIVPRQVKNRAGAGR